jgi:hypothetical protein
MLKVTLRTVPVSQTVVVVSFSVDSETRVPTVVTS